MSLGYSYFPSFKKDGNEQIDTFFQKTIRKFETKSPRCQIINKFNHQPKKVKKVKPPMMLRFS